MGDQPRLIVPYTHQSLDLLLIRAGARGWCELIWVIDEAFPPAVNLRPLLERTGTVVTGLERPPAQVADVLRPYEPDGVCAFSDRGMVHLAEIARELGLGFYDPDTALALEDKLEQRARLAAGGIPTPPVVAIADQDRDAVLELVREFPFPAVLKPREAAGSWYAFVVSDPAEVVERMDWIAGAEREGGEPPQMLLEGYLPGVEMPGGFEADFVSVESIITGGEARHIATTGRLPLVPPLRETGSFVPATLAEQQAEEVRDLAGRALAALGMELGTAHTEIKLTPQGPRIIEINGRVGGGLPEILGLLGGPNIVELSMRNALGLPAEPEPKNRAGVGYRFIYQPPLDARKLVSLTGLDELRGRPDVEEIRVHHPPGAAIDAREGTRAYLFDAFGVTPDHRGLGALVRSVESSVAATYEP